jgi:DNA-binding HxlR family transcriptional regulator
VNQEHQQIETKLLELTVVLKIIRGKSFKKKKSFTFLQNQLQKMSADTLTSKMERNFQGSLLQKAIYTYREIEVNFLQISELQNFV